MLRGSGKSPRKWLAEVDDETFNDWKAYFALEPWGDERQMLATIAIALKRLVALKYDPDDRTEILESVDKQASYMMPADWIGQPEDSEVDSIEAFGKQMEAMYGHQH